MCERQGERLNKEALSGSHLQATAGRTQTRAGTNVQNACAPYVETHPTAYTGLLWARNSLLTSILVIYSCILFPWV